MHQSVPNLHYFQYLTLLLWNNSIFRQWKAGAISVSIWVLIWPAADLLCRTKIQITFISWNCTVNAKTMLSIPDNNNMITEKHNDNKEIRTIASQSQILLHKFKDYLKLTTGPAWVKISFNCSSVASYGIFPTREKQKKASNVKLTFLKNHF